jgi:hypothetical protein
MALTILEAAKLQGDIVREAVVEMFARESEILAALPFENIQGNALRYNREGQLPGIAFRGINEPYAESVGVLNPIVEALAIAGGDLDVDKFIVRTMGENQRSTHEQLKVKALAQSWANTFIKGDSTSDPRVFDGLQMRVTGTQLLAAGATPNGDALSLAKLDEAIDLVDNPTHLIMAKSLRRRLAVAARTPTVAGYVTYTPDDLGRRVMRYNDLPILVAYGANGGNEILTFTEACPGGGTLTGSSIYVVSFGDGRLTGIQNGDMMVTDLGELPTAPVYRTRVEWYAGIALQHGRAVSRLWGVSNAAIVA